MLSLLRSAGFARAVLLYLGCFIGVVAWLPWVRSSDVPAPGWALAVGLAHPFSSAWFLAGCLALFASTLACTWGRWTRAAALHRGELPGTALPLAARPGAGVAEFLRQNGFRGQAPVSFRHRWALHGGWLLHVGLLALIAGIAVQQAFHDSGAFELSEGEQLDLSAPGAVLGREKGPLAPRAPPAIQVALESFDPYLHQQGYAPDRQSRLTIRPAGGEEMRAVLDRAAGVRAGGVQLYQAIPTGLSLNVELPGLGFRSIHLREEEPRRAAAEVSPPSGSDIRLVVETERPVTDVRGTGRLLVWLEHGGQRVRLEPGAAFDWGNAKGRLVSVGRWAGFTYSRSPGIWAVFAGFALVLAGAALLAFPAGVARLDGAGDNCAARVWLARGGEALRKEWDNGPQATEP